MSRERSLTVATAIILILVWLLLGFFRVRRGNGEAVRTLPSAAPSHAQLSLRQSLDSLLGDLGEIDSAITHRRAVSARAATRRAHETYKRGEALIAYYSPTTVAELVGPLEDDGPDAAPRPLNTPALFARVDADLSNGRWSDARSSVAEMRRTLTAFRDGTPLLRIADTSVLDAARLQLARITTLDIAGVDALPSTRDTLAEVASAIDGVADIVRDAGVSATLHNAAAYVRRAPNFAGLDRFEFLASYALPAAHALMSARRSLTSTRPAIRRLWRASSASPYDSNAFDVSALAEEPDEMSSGMEALGARLFTDPQLSGPGTHSCASCHQPNRSFSDGRRSPALLKPTAHARKTPTLLNAAFQPALFADARARSLEEQAGAVLASAGEMGSSASLAAVRVNADPRYASLLRRVARGKADERVIRTALAAYVRSLTALDSRFDRAVRGDAAVLTTSERRGFNLFMGKAQCGTCHFAPLFNGTRPPDFVSSELEIIGAPRIGADVFDSDRGRAAVDHNAFHRYAFRIPTIRNAAHGPYMHNGVFASLREVIDFYDRGGARSGSRPVPRQTLDSSPLHLTWRDKRDIEAFIRALTDSTPLVAKP